MRKSLKTQIAVLFIGLIGFVFLANWCTNNFLLERYYVAKKEAALQRIYDNMNKVEDVDDYLMDDFENTLSEYCTRYNLSAIILTDEFVPLLYGTENYQKQELQGRLWGYLMGIDKSETEVLKENDNYVIQKTQDFKDKVDYLEIWGVFNTGYYFMMRIPMESIRDSVRTSNEFLGYFIVIGLAVSMILISWMSRKITTPLQELTELSKRMADLDFDAKYTSGGQNEIGQLGEHFNQMSETLERTISELKTANNQLQNDIEEKIQIDEMRKEFLSNVSHELKTPLTSMKVLADSINSMEDAPIELYKEFMGDIGNEVDRETKIINDLLSLVKMDKAAGDLNITNININELLEQILKRLRPIADKQKVELVLESFRPVSADVDEVKITLAFTNLIENAIKYNKEDGWVHVSLNADHQYFYLKVEDSGIGIPEDSLGHIYERFYRVDKSHSREIGGTGLGLAITRNAVLMHRGAIKVFSTEGEGTIFNVRIPLNYIS